MPPQHILYLKHTLSSLTCQLCSNQVLMWAWVQVPIPEAQVHKLREGLPVGQAATEYAGQLLGLDPLVLPRNSAGACHKGNLV